MVAPFLLVILIIFCDPRMMALTIVLMIHQKSLQCPLSILSPHQRHHGTTWLQSWAQGVHILKIRVKASADANLLASWTIISF